MGILHQLMFALSCLALLATPPSAFADPSCKSRFGEAVDSGEVRDNPEYILPDGRPCITWSGANVRKLYDTGAAAKLFPWLALLCRRNNTPVNIFSGYRSPEHNKCVGGATHSQHLLGIAIDFTTSIPREKVLQFLKSVPGGRGNYGGNSYHLDARKDNVCWEALAPICTESRAILAQRKRDAEQLTALNVRQAATTEPITKPADYVPPVFTAQDSVTHYMAMNPNIPAKSNSESFYKTEAYMGAGLPIVFGGVAAVGGLAIFASGGGNEGDRRPTQTSSDAENTNDTSVEIASVNQSADTTSATQTEADRLAAALIAQQPTTSSNSGASIIPGTTPALTAAAGTDPTFDGTIVEVPPPRICPSAGTITVTSCMQNYSLATAAGLCLFRVRESERIAAMVLAQKSVHTTDGAQNLAYRDGSYDYKVTEAISRRHRQLIQMSQLEVRSYRNKVMYADEIEMAKPDQVACYRENMIAIDKVLAEMQIEIVKAETNAQANGFLKMETKDSQEDIASSGASNGNEVNEAVQSFDSAVRSQMPIDTNADPMANEL